MHADGQLLRQVESLAAALVELVFPPRCAGCRRLGSKLCRSCQARITPLGDVVCTHCGLPLAQAGPCETCRRLPSGPLVSVRGVVFYDGPLVAAIHAFKYHGRREMVAPLAAYLIAFCDTHPLPVDVLAPVPLHPARLVARGYNQSELLAQALGAARNLPVRTDLISRTRHTQPQVTLDAHQRRANVLNAFAPVQPAALHGECVLLIDDVCTTGATLEACALALQAAGAGKVWGLTVARVHWEPGAPPPDRRPSGREDGL